MVWFLRRSGLKTGADFAYFGLNSSMVLDEMHELTCRFNYKLMNKKERVICEVEVDFKKSFCWRSNVSNDNIISAYARSENGYGFYEDSSVNRCGKKQLFGLEIGAGFGEPGGTPPRRIPRNTPPPGKFISVTSSVVLSFSCLLILLFLSREHIVLFFFK